MTLSLENVNTKLEAYKLVHDPTRLLSLLFSKYGDIEEDYYLYYTNQIFYNVSSHFNCVYRENEFIYNIDEFLKRFYKKKECIDRLPKLSDYYKNYLKFFCRPFFKNYKLGKILHDFEDKKAEIFYKNNYADSANELEEKEKEKENSDKKSSSSLSSLDNITDNKIIFDKRTKNIIDNNLNSECCTITLTLESSRMNLMKDNNKDNNIFYNGGLISKRSNGNSSFEKNIYSLVHYKLNKKKENKDQNLRNNKKNQSHKIKKLLNSPSSPNRPYFSTIYKKNDSKNKNIKNSLFTIARKNYIKNNCFISYKNGKGFLSPKIIKHNINFNNGISSKYEEFDKNKPINYNNVHNSGKKNKTFNNSNNFHSNNNNNINKIYKTKNSNSKISNGIITNTIYKNFSNLSETLKYKNLCNKNSNITYTNKNNSNILKTKKNINSENVIIKSNNNESKKIKKKVNIFNKASNNQLKKNNLIHTNFPKNPSINLNINVNKPQISHLKNKTYDFNTIIQNEPLTKYNTNNNFDNFKSLLSNNKNNHKRKKISSKFNLIKKPISEVIQSNPLLSPQVKKSFNKLTNNQSISQNKEKKKKIFYGFSNNKINKYNKYNIPQNKYEYDSPKVNPSNKKKSSITFSSEDNNKLENLNIERIVKRTKKRNKYSNKNSQIKKSNNKLNSIKPNNNWKIQSTCISPLSNYSTNLNRIRKNINYSSFNNTIKMDNSGSHNSNEALKTKKKENNNKINKKLNTSNKNNNFNNNSNNKINPEFYEVINQNKNDNLAFSRNKKQNSSKISNTQSQNEIHIKDERYKSIKNLKFNCVGSKSNIKNITCSNDINYIFPKKNLYSFSSKINSSTEVRNNHIKDMLFHLNRISIKKKSKKNSQRNSKIKEKNKIFLKPKKKIKNTRAMFSGDNINNHKKIIEIKQNSINKNNRTNHKDNNIVIANNTISHRERGNSIQIINVNRNIHLFNKNEKNKQKIEKI